MFKLNWKQGWKRKDAETARPSQEADGPADTQSSGADAGGPSQDSANAAAPSSTQGVVPEPAAPPTPPLRRGTRGGRNVLPGQQPEEPQELTPGRRRKRVRVESSSESLAQRESSETSTEKDTNATKPSAKVSSKKSSSKRGSAPSTPSRSTPVEKQPEIDSLAKHLPEILPEDVPATETFHSGPAENVLEQAKQENTIAIVSSSAAASELYIAFLTWAVERERRRPIRKPRPSAMFIVEDDRSIEIFYNKVFSGSDLVVGKFTEKTRKENSARWLELLPNDVVIVSANALLDCLLQETALLAHMHCIVICDAHNIKDQQRHPVVRIMDEFYHPAKEANRPRVLAVALASTEKRFFFDSSMIKLEDTFRAAVFGLTEQQRREILAIPDRPLDMIVLYNAALRTAETHLFRELLKLDPGEKIFRRHFKAARHALAELGSCGSDLIWRRALRDIEASIPEDYDEDDDTQPPAEMQANKAKARIRDIVKNWIFTMPNLDLSARGFNVTPKLLKLVQTLDLFDSYGDTFRGIIFVQRRAVAHVLTELLRSLDGHDGFFRPCALVGHGTSVDQQQQDEILRCFANGTYNLLIATKFAEDLDMPKAVVVIRYDLFESQVSQAYVRARTRGRESHLIHMVERGNDVHRRIISQVTQVDPLLHRWIEAVFMRPGSAVPPRHLKETIDPYRSESEDDEDESVQYIKDPTTSGRIYLQDATTVIYRLVSNAELGDAGARIEDPLFLFKDVLEAPGATRRQICTVNFPNLLLQHMSGPACLSESHARRAACFEACSELFTRGLLSYDLFPISPSASLKEVVADNVDLDKPTGTKGYPRKQPDFWANMVNIPRKALYPTVVSVDATTDDGKKYAPMAILTWQPLPEFRDFKIFFSGVPAIIRCRRGAPFEVGEDRLQDLYQYTLRVTRSVSNKAHACSFERLAYFFSPVDDTWDHACRKPVLTEDFPNAFEHIPWDAVSKAAKDAVVPLQRESIETLAADIEDAIIQDRWTEFTRRYDAICVRPDLNPLSKPADSPREADYENLLDYCRKRRKNFEELEDETQPLIEVAKVPPVLNRLNPTSRQLKESAKSSAKYLIPELCVKFTIPASTFRTARLLPSITRRIDDLLIVKELNAKFFDHTIKEPHLHAAISAPSSGIEFDYERLELLGDAFLKYLSSVYLFVTNPAQHEGALHVARQKIISNRSLLQNASRACLPPYIQSKPFMHRLWSPPNFELQPMIQAPKPATTEETAAPEQDPKPEGEEGVIETPGDGVIHVDNTDTDTQMVSTDLDELMATSAGGAAPAGDAMAVDPLIKLEEGEIPLDQPSETIEEPPAAAEAPKPKKKSKKKRQMDEMNIQFLGDKAVADVAEAIIGAAYISGGRETALKVTKALQIPVPNIDRWSDFGRKVLAPPPGVTARLRVGSLEAVETAIGHKFERPHLLAQALTHASIQGYETTSYERLEFIGDAILDFMVIRHIYDRDQQLSPGGLTLLKGAMVSNSTLAAVCVWAGLHEHLLYESFTLASAIQAYVDKLKLAQAEEYEHAMREHRTPGQYWVEIEPPKALSDVIESIIGAVYISDNFSPVGAESLFDNVLKPFFDRHITLKTLSQHPTKILFELFQAQGCMQFEIIKVGKEEDGTTRCDVLVHDVILASGNDTTPTFAARRASFHALDALEGDADFLTRTCDCRTHTRKLKQKTVDKMLAKLDEDEEEGAEVEAALAEDEDEAEQAKGDNQQGGEEGASRLRMDLEDTGGMSVDELSGRPTATPPVLDDEVMLIERTGRSSSGEAMDTED